jgi:ADP-ribosylglycohydrolase
MKYNVIYYMTELVKRVKIMLFVSLLVDLISVHIFDTIYKDILEVIKNPNDNGEIMIEYFSYFLSKGGITNFEFEGNISVSSNGSVLVAFLDIINLIIKENKSDQLLYHFKKILKTIFSIEQNVAQIFTESGTTEKYILNMKESEQKNDNYVGPVNNNYNSDICVFVIPFGIYFYNNLNKMIEFVVKITKIAHNNIISILSAIVSSYFITLAINKIPIEEWGEKVIELLKSKMVKKYIDFDENKNIMDYTTFMKYWVNYMEIRFSEKKVKKTKSDYNLIYRIKFYKKYIFDTKEAILGKDNLNCLFIVYDTLLMCEDNFEKAIYYGLLIPGYVISVGGLLGALYGLVYGDKYIPEHLRKKMNNFGENENLKNLFSNFTI